MLIMKTGIVMQDGFESREEMKCRLFVANKMSETHGKEFYLKFRVQVALVCVVCRRRCRGCRR